MKQPSKLLFRNAGLILMSLICSIVVTFYGWNTAVAQEKITDWDSLDNYAPVLIQYDTLEGEFLYENLVAAYIEGDAVGKERSFVIMEENNEDLYKHGIITYFTSDFWYDKMKNKNDTMHYNPASVFKMLEDMQDRAVKNGTFWEPTDIHPFCGAYYKLYRMKIEVLYLGLVKQKIPLFMNCKEAKKYLHKNNGKNYQECSIPTYLITHVFEWGEI